MHHRWVAQQQEGSSAEPGTGKRAVFRVPAIATLGVLFLAVCMTPVAGSSIWLLFLYLIPITLLVWLLRTRTVATVDGLTVRTVFSTRVLPWSTLRGLALTDRAKVRAVLSEGGEVTLPAVRTRHLPVLSLVSGGRVKDPSGVLDAQTESSADDSPATEQ